MKFHLLIVMLDVQHVNYVAANTCVAKLETVFKGRSFR